MRINYYQFPEDTPEDIRLKEGCGVILKNGDTIYPDSIPVDQRSLIDCVEDTLGGISVTAVKKLIRKYGGCGWTDHCERDGGVFETTNITLQGNNTRFKYNCHL